MTEDCKVYYKERPIEELSRKELIKVLKEGWDLYHSLRKDFEEVTVLAQKVWRRNNDQTRRDNG